MTGISGVSPYMNNYQYYNYSVMRASGTSKAAQLQVSGTSKAGQTAAAQRAGGVVLSSGGRVSNPGVPVEPVSPVPAISAQASRGVSYAIPFLRQGMDPAELAVRMRIQYVDDADTDNKLEEECQTCKERKYQDGSNDAGVSYKTPTHIAPEQAASAVRGHEMEHVVREQAKADNEDREVLSQTVMIHNEICPECGKVYVSGGTTRTVTAERQETGDESAGDKGEGI